MPHIRNGFGPGQGLQVQANRKTQGGLLDARNLDLEHPHVIRKRPGDQVYSLSRSSTDPTDMIPPEQTRALWSRDDEVLLETDRSLYSLQRCADGATGSVTQGTATSMEISDGLDVLQTRASRAPVFDVPLPGDASAASARLRANRPSIPVPLVITPSGRTITITISSAGSNALQYSVTENATTKGPFAFPGPGPQVVSAIQDLSPFAATDDVVITWLGNGVLRALRLTPEPGDANMSSVSTVLDAVRGAPLTAWQEARNNAVAVFLPNGSLKVYTAVNLADARTFGGISNPPPTSGTYVLDILPTAWPTLPAGVAWLGSDHNLVAIEIEPVGVTVDAQAVAPNQWSLGNRQVGIETSSIPGTAFVVAVTNDNRNTEPTFGLISSPSPDPDLRATDFDGDGLRVSIVVGQNGNPTQYSIRNATTNEQVSNTTTILTGTLLDAAFVLRGDEIFGGSTADGQAYEHRWRRSFALGATAVLGATTDQVAVAASADRFLLAYTLGGLILVRGRNTVDTPVPTSLAFVLGTALDETAPVAIGVLTEVGGTDYTARFHAFTSTGDYYATTATSAAGTLAGTITAAWSELPIYTSSYAVGTPPRVLFGAEYASTSQELWEDDQAAPLFVRVFPPIVVPAGGQWAERGPWHRTRLRSRVVRRYEQGSNSVESADAAGTLNSTGEPCIFVAIETTNSPPSEFAGAQADILSTHTEAHLTLDALGERPRVGTYGSGEAFVVYYDSSGDLQHATWSPGSALSFSAVGATPTTVDTWDLTTGDSAGTAVACVAWDVSGGGGTLTIRVYPDGGTPFSFTRAHGLVAVDVAVFFEEVDGVVFVAWSVAGSTVGPVNGFVSGLDTLDLGAGTAAAVFQRTVNAGAGITPFATVVGRLSSTSIAVWLETDEGLNRRVRQYDVIALSETLVRTVLRSAIVSQLARLGGDLVGVESMLAEDKVQRNGLIMRAHTSGEFVGRVGIGDTEDEAERPLRYPHTGLNRDPDGRLLLGWQETSFSTDDTRARLSTVYIWDPNVGAHNPAVLDGVAVAAHGGYPRMTDGQNVHEHDWHHLPEIDTVLLVGGGGASAGSYLIALTWQDVDALGFLYRSRPTIFGPITAAAGNAFNVQYRGLTHTERSATRLATWRTIANGTEFYFESETVATLSVDTTLQSLLKTDAQLLTGEVLDQGEGAGLILESDPVAITDFTAIGNGRIWSRDPRDGKHARYTLTSRALSAGRFHVHWNLNLVVAHTTTRELTAVAEMDARVLLITALDMSAVYGDGVDNTGGGTPYNVPATIPVEIGAADHATLALIDEGLVYSPGSGEPVAMLARTFTNVPLAQQVPEQFLAQGQTVVAVAYREQTETLLLLDAGIPGGATATLRYHTGTQRWSFDTLRQGKDLTTTNSGDLYILTLDSRVLREDRGRHDSGGVGYITSIRTQWYSRGSVTQPMDARKVQFVGSWLGSHGLVLRSYFDYGDIAAEEAAIPTATVDGNDAVGHPYIYEYTANLVCQAWSIEVADTGEPNETFALEQVAVDVGDVTDAALNGELLSGHSFDKVTP